MPVTVFNPNGSPTSTSVDGVVGENTAGESFSTKRGNAGNTSASSPATTKGCQVLSTSVSNQYDTFNRGIFLFDTSSLGAGVGITGATFDVYVTAARDEFSPAASVDLVLSNPASNTALVNSDYNIANWTMADQATPLTIAGMTLNARNVWTLNATGVNNINKAGITKLGLVVSYDFSNTAPTWASAVEASISCQFATNGPNKPQLTVTWSGVKGGSKAFLMGM